MYTPLYTAMPSYCSSFSSPAPPDSSSKLVVIRSDTSSIFSGFVEANRDNVSCSDRGGQSEGDDEGDVCDNSIGSNGGNETDDGMMVVI